MKNYFTPILFRLSNILPRGCSFPSWVPPVPQDTLEEEYFNLTAMKLLDKDRQRQTKTDKDRQRQTNTDRNIQVPT